MKFGVALLAVALGTCSRDREPRGLDAAAPAKTARYPRFWFRRGVIRLPDGASVTVNLTSPRLVEKRDDDVVSVEDPTWRGAWPWPKRPEPGMGLMLYAQRHVVLLDGSGHPADVTLDPGALVAVVPAEGGYLVAPGSPAGSSVMFAPAEAMGTTEPVATSAPSNLGAVRASRCPDDDFGNWSRERCTAVLLGPRHGEVSQRVELVEKRGWIRFSPDYTRCYRAPHWPIEPHCVASSVSRDATGLHLSSPAGRDQAIAEVPRGYREIASRPTPLSTWLRRGRGSFHVLTWHDEKIFCREVPFEGAVEGEGVTGRLRETNDKWVSFVFREAPARGVATLAAADDQGTKRADVAFVVGGGGDEVHVLRQPLEPGALFYREAEAERWFETAADCGAAAEAVRVRVAADGHEMLSVGVHVPLYFGLFWAHAPK